MNRSIGEVHQAVSLTTGSRGANRCIGPVLEPLGKVVVRSRRRRTEKGLALALPARISQEARIVTKTESFTALALGEQHGEHHLIGAGDLQAQQRNLSGNSYCRRASYPIVSIRKVEQWSLLRLQVVPESHGQSRRSVGGAEESRSRDSSASAA